VPPKYPPLEYGPVGLKPVVSGPDKIFIRWMADMHQEVQEGDPIALVQPHKTIIKAPHAGKIVAKAPLKHGDVIDDRMVDHNIATLDERLDPLPVSAKLEEKGEEEPRSLYFVKWLKEIGDPVKKGDPLCKLSTNDPLKSGGQLGKVTTVHAEADGFLKSREPFVMGDEIGDVKQNIKGKAVIAVIEPEEPGIPWWVWLLLAAALALCIALLLLLCCFPKEKPKETYKALPPVKDALPPPPPPPAAVPPGLRLDFDDHLGNIKTIYATYRPLGIINRESAPINVDDLTFNSYAMSMGVRETWTIVRVGNVDVRGKTNYSEVKGLVNDGLKNYPIWPLKMELTKAGTGEKKEYSFPCRPLGFEFDNKAPIRVKQVYPNSQAQAMGMKDHLRDKETWALTNLNNTDLPPEEHDFQKVFGMMKDGVRALDPYTTNDGSRSVDQLAGWD